MTSAFGAQPLAAPRPHGRLNMSGRSTVVDSPGPGSFCTARADPARSAGAYQHLERGPQVKESIADPGIYRLTDIPGSAGRPHRRWRERAARERGDGSRRAPRMASSPVIRSSVR